MSAPGRFGFQAPRAIATGAGFLAGEPPAAPADPESPDGRAKINGVPSRVRILVYDRSVLTQPLESTLSDTDGTWHIGHLDPARHYLVLGMDDAGTVSAAVQDWVRPDVLLP